ncbi:MAG: SGNH/GDSL hydrolase family protein [Bacteroidia bacterium]
MEKTHYTFRQKLVYSVVGGLILLVIVLLLSEMLARFINVMKPERNPPYNTSLKDEKMGWKCKPNYDFKGKMKDEKKKVYEVHYFTDAQGFKNYCPKDSLKNVPSIWFLGDSYIQSVEVSNEATFYSLAAKQIPMNLFAYGMSGWGNLQEYMMLDAYFEKIQPDVVVLQVCTNDFIDNLEAMEREAIYQVNERRPYLTISDSVYYAQVNKPVLCQYSQLYAAVFPYFRRIDIAMNEKKWAEYKVAQQKTDYPLYAQSLSITENILRKFQQRLGNKAQLYLLDTDNIAPFHQDWQKIAQKLGISLIEQVPEKFQAAKKKGVTIHSVDGWHWNPEGHRIAAEALVEFFTKEIAKGEIPKKQ